MFILGDYEVGDTIYFYFDTYDSNGASVTISGLAVTDLELFRNGSMTQRSSDNGFALLDSDGIDIDSTTGLHGFSVDTSDNSDSSFYSAGSQYLLNVNAITVDSQTVRFSYQFTLGRLMKPATAGRKPVVDSSGLIDANTVKLGPTGSGTAQTARDIGASVLLSSGTGTGQLDFTSGVVKANVTQNAGTNITASGGRQEVNVSHWAGSATPVTNFTTVFSTDFAANYDTTNDKWKTNVSFFGDADITGSEVGGNLFTFFDNGGNPSSATQDNISAILTDTGTTLDGKLDTLLTRITSSLFSGITSLAQWLGAGFGKQSGNSTAVTEIRATGAGSGGYDPTTDSLEAVRDNQQSAATAALNAYDPPTRAEATTDRDYIVARLHWKYSGTSTDSGGTNIITDSGVTGIPADGLLGAMIEVRDTSTGAVSVSTITDFDDGGPTWTFSPNASFTIAIGDTYRIFTKDPQVALILDDTGNSGVVVASGSKSGYSLANDSITSNTFDESSAFPVKSADTGDTTILRKGSGSITGTTLDSAIAGVSGAYISDSGTAQAGAAGTLTLQSGAVATDDYYNYQILTLTGGTGAGQARIISDYVGSTKVASVNGNWATTPDNTTTYQVTAFGQIPGASAPTANEVRDAVWSATTRQLSGTVKDFDELIAGAEDTEAAIQAGLTAQGYTEARAEALDNVGEGGTSAQLLKSTTIATLASQTSFTLTDGSTDDNAYKKEKGVQFIITDQSNADQKAVVDAASYVGLTRTVTLNAAPVFTIAVGDQVDIMALGFTPAPRNIVIQSTD